MNKRPSERNIDAARIERALLEAFHEDVPRRGAKLAAMAALGAGIAHAGVTSAAVGGIAGAKAGARTAIASASKGTALAVLKWFGVGMLGGAAVVGPRELVGRRQPSLDATALVRTTPTRATTRTTLSGPAIIGESDPTDRSHLASTPAPLVREPSSQVATPVRTGTGSPGAIPPPAPPEVQAASTPTPTPTQPPSRLGEETGLLDGARQALAGGHPRAALELLDRYDREFPGGTLKPESVVLRVDSLVKSGNGAAAIAYANGSSAALPEKYAQKIRLLLSQ
jgi:hypothetical protein